MLLNLRGTALAALLIAATAAQLDAQTIGTTRVATGLSRPVFCTSPAGDLQRLFIVEQWNARILILRNGALLPTAFLDINPITIGNSSEAGLLGLAFHPDYASNGYFFVHYNNNSGNTVIARYQVSANPDIADPNSAQIIFTTTQPFSNHNGGMLAFGPDGYLYIGLGDGGSANDPGGRAQTLSTPLGKMLRIDIDNPAPGAAYGIPASNPFVGTTSALPEIWAYGLRNPWRFSFDSQTGDMYIADVGQNAWEEIDFQPAASTGGENYGWRCMEGNACTGLSGCTCNAASLTDPIHVYSHSLGFSITGGYVYRGCAIPGLDGTYFFADYGTARIWSFRYQNNTMTEFTERTTQLRPPTGQGTIASISSFGQDAFGELYICDLSGGEIFKIVPIGAVDCNANGRPDICDLAYGTSLDLDSNGQPDECQSFYADRATLSVSNGGTQSMTLRGTFFQGGSTYLIAGSLSGANPGLNLGNFTIPLNADPYFFFTLEAPNGGLITNSLGTLDAFGRGQATFTIPAGFPELAGLTAYHAWIRVLPVLDFASNYITVTFTL